MDYESLSDFEVNKAVAEALGERLYNNGASGAANHVAIKFTRAIGGAVHYNPFLEVDYCNNPSDAWPAIVENRINIIAEWPDKGWYCNVTPTVATIKYHSDDNPLRAAMIVFLKMMEAKDAN